MSRQAQTAAANTDLDPRTHAYRADLAAAHLRGRVAAARFVDGRPMQVVAGVAGLRTAPAADAPLGSELLFGERFTVYDGPTEDGWCWGQNRSDGYVGYVEAAALGAPGPAPSHRVQAMRTLVFGEPSIKTSPADALSFGARVAVAEEGLWHNGAELARLADGRYVAAQHLAPIDHVEPDWPAVAERFVGVPYLFGGRSSLGIDCSALLQLALDAAGIACPRDTDQQQTTLGEDLGGEPGAKLGSVHDAMLRPGPGSLPLRRGDLVFLPRHVGIMLDSARLLHGNAHHMAVAVEPLQRALTRIAARYGIKVAAIKRLSE